MKEEYAIEYRDGSGEWRVDELHATQNLATAKNTLLHHQFVYGAENARIVVRLVGVWRVYCFG